MPNANTKVSSMWQRFTESARRVVWHAHQASIDAKVIEASSEHLLLGLCLESEAIACQALVETGVDLATLEKAIRQVIQTGNADPEEPRNLATDNKNVLDRAFREARERNNDYVGTEHLLLGLIQVDSQAARVLSDCGVNLEPVRSAIDRLQGR